MATSGTSVRLKRLRQRFGISAPRLAIRTHVPWYWRLLAAVAILSVSLALAVWMYDAGRRIAGFHSDESVREIQSLREHLMELDAELTKLRGLAGTGESNLRMERATQQQLSRQVEALESENAALREDLAFFEGLMPPEGGGEAGVRIDKFRIDQVGVTDEYRYRMLVVNGDPKHSKAFRGTLQLLLKVRQGGKDVMIIFPSDEEGGAQNYRFEVKNFHRLEGVFFVPNGSVPVSIEARLLQDGNVRAKQSVTL